MSAIVIPFPGPRCPLCGRVLPPPSSPGTPPENLPAGPESALAEVIELPPRHDLPLGGGIRPLQFGYPLGNQALEYLYSRFVQSGHPEEQVSHVLIRDGGHPPQGKPEE